MKVEKVLQRMSPLHHLEKTMIDVCNTCRKNLRL